MKKTLVIGASENTERYANMAMALLKQYGHPVLAIGNREGMAHGIAIEKGKPVFEDVDTVTLYVGPRNQPEFYDYLLQLKPKRVLFNPGTENPALESILQENGIATEEACTLVLLRTGNY